MVEFYLAFSLLFLLSVFVFYSNNIVSAGTLLGVQCNFVGLFLLFFACLFYLSDLDVNLSLLSNVLLRDIFSSYIALLSICGACFILFFANFYMQKSSLAEYEFFFILLLIILGLLCIIFSNDFITLYLGIELQSLGLYILATIKNNSTFATEAGLKYFVLGAFASTLLLFGCILLYGLTGLLNFDDLAFFIINNEFIHDNVKEGLSMCFVFIFISLFFKIGGAPFHMWVPDVYEGSSSIITAFFALVPKIGIISILCKLVYFFYFYLISDITLLFFYSGLLSCIIGLLGALGQQKIKRILSYSAISHSGILLFCLGIGSYNAFVATLFYITIYFCLIAFLFGSFLGSQKEKSNSIIKLVGNLSYVYISNKWLGITFIIALFSLAGIPPLTGFFSKLFVFFASIEAGYFILSLLLILISAFGALYYLRLIRSMMFLVNKRQWILLSTMSQPQAYIISFFLLFNIAFMYWGSILIYFFSNICLIYLF